jgi:hypothetical protein
MRETNLLIVNIDSKYGENCQPFVKFNTIDNLFEQIDQITKELGYFNYFTSIDYDYYNILGFNEDELNLLDTKNIRFSMF